MKIFFYDVAVPLPIRHCFTYKSDQLIRKGSRIVIPFGSRKLIGIIVKKIVPDEDIKKDKSIKYIDSVIDQFALFENSIFDTIIWASEYYHHPIGEVFQSFIPTSLRQAKTNIDIDESLVNNSIYEIEEVDKKFGLTSYQSKAVNRLSNLKGFKPSLLYGVTGSGKTEVYLRLTEDLIKKKKSVLILVPEINLTPQLLKRFESRFKGEIGLYHSKQTPKKRLNTWLKAKFGKINIVIGTRSSILMPLKNLGLIIIDEEHDQSYRQSDGFKFSARDVGIKRAQEEKIPIILGSATPSLQTLRLVQEKKYKKIDMLTRVDGKAPPRLITMDINNSNMEGGIAEETVDAIKATLKKNEQVLIFINRRGFAPIFQCGQCGWVAECKSCDSNLVYHQNKNRLICHRCESAYLANNSCPECNKKDFYFHGTGTERIEEILSNTFLDTPIIRVDQDSTKKVGSMDKIIQDINSANAAILVGTQMLAKGHDFPKVTLSIILNADNGLISPEINALEKISQLLIQVSGRAGRNNNLAKVLIQTRYPDDINLNKIKTGDYLSFAMQCLSKNKKIGLPPYSAMCMLRCSSPTQKNNINFLNKAVRVLNKKPDLSVIGPLPSLISKSKGNFRHNVYIQANQKSQLNRILKRLIKELSDWPESKKVKWTFDIDPIEIN
ncbi:MAG: replication restart helicase PriA [Gammaproteobacteria bacterium]